MILAITYGDEKFDSSAKLNVWSARHIGGADKATRFSPKDIDKEFMQENIKILSQPRGGGYWLWKPYFILKELDKINMGDYLFYADAGTVYTNSIRHLTKQLEQDKKDIALSSSMWHSRYWCKREAFVLMDCDEEKAYRSHQVATGYLLLRKSDFSIEFVKKWLRYMQDERISTDLPSQCGKTELDGFRDNRHDQTVLSLLAYKEKIVPYRSFTERCEYKRYSHFGEGGFFNFSKQELWEQYTQEISQGYYKESTHPRILVNTNIYNRSGIGFYLRVMRRLVEAVWRDYGPAPKAPRLRKE